MFSHFIHYFKASWFNNLPWFLNKVIAQRPKEVYLHGGPDPGRWPCRAGASSLLVHLQLSVGGGPQDPWPVTHGDLWIEWRWKGWKGWIHDHPWHSQSLGFLGLCQGEDMVQMVSRTTLDYWSGQENVLEGIYVRWLGEQQDRNAEAAGCVAECHSNLHPNKFEDVWQEADVVNVVHWLRGSRGLAIPNEWRPVLPHKLWWCLPLPLTNWGKTTIPKLQGWKVTVMK